MQVERSTSPEDRPSLLGIDSPEVKMCIRDSGMSFVEYVSRKRIDASKKLLKETNLKVYEVAEKIGFKDAHYFCICFKKQTGQTIKEYRGA